MPDLAREAARCIQATPLRKIDLWAGSAIACPHRDPTISGVRVRGCAIWPGWSLWRLENMNLRRLMTLSTLWRTAVVPSGVVVWLLAFGSTGMENTGAAPIVSRVVPSLTADTSSDTPQPAALGNADVGNADVVMDGSSPTGIAADTTLASREPETQESETI